MAYNLTVADLLTYFVVVGGDEVLDHDTCRPDLNGDARIPAGKSGYLVDDPGKKEPSMIG